MSFTLEDGVFGPRMVVTGPWREELLGEVECRGVVELELNYAKGWQRTELDFLKRLKGLQCLELTDWNIQDVSPIHAVGGLRRLKLSTYCKTEIRFDAFPHLVDVSLEWRPRAKSLFASEAVQRVFLNRYPGRNLTDFAGMRQLAELQLASPRLEALSGLKSERLTLLGVYRARRLVDIDGVRCLPALQRLELNECRKISDIAPLAALAELRALHLCDDGQLASLLPACELKQLRELMFYGDTDIVDGKLACLDSLKVARIAFQERPHYDRKPADLD